jgi:osmotically-inducible protein OsmY
MRDAMSVKGVNGVNNQLVVVPGRHEPRPRRAEDNEIRSAVRARLDDAHLEHAHVDVRVVAGVVQLAGTVRDPQDRLTAVTIARSTDGVRGVRDDLHEEGGPRAAR